MNNELKSAIIRAGEERGIIEEGAPVTDQTLLNIVACLGMGPKSAALSSAEAVSEFVPDDSQDWAKLDGATAYHLIERHADNWSEARNMMETWGRARFAAPQSSQPIVQVSGAVTDELRQLYIDLTNADQVTEAGEVVGYLITRDQLDELDHLSRALQSTPAQAPVSVSEGFKLVRSPITEEMHIAAAKVLHRATGLDGLPQRMLDAMIAAAPAQAQQKYKRCEACNNDTETYTSSHSGEKGGAK